MDSITEPFDLLRARPDEWFVVFGREAHHWAAKWLSFGRFKHVTAFGMLPDGQNWIIHEVRPAYTAVFVVPDEHFNGKLAFLIENAVVVRMPAPDMYDLKMRPRAGWWCVPATAHLLGIRSCALRPDCLFRDCLRQGGVVVCGEAESEAAEGRAGSGNRAPA